MELELRTPTISSEDWPKRIDYFKGVTTTCENGLLPEKTPRSYANSQENSDGSTENPPCLRDRLFQTEDPILTTEL